MYSQILVVKLEDNKALLWRAKCFPLPIQAELKSADNFMTFPIFVSVQTFGTRIG